MEVDQVHLAQVQVGDRPRCMYHPQVQGGEVEPTEE